MKDYLYDPDRVENGRRQFKKVENLHFCLGCDLYIDFSQWLFAGHSIQFIQLHVFSLLFIGGIGLIRGTLTSTQTGTTRGFLFLTGISTTLLLIVFIGYEWFRLKGDQDLETFIESFLYLVTLFFWVGVIGSLTLIKRWSKPSG